MQDILDVMIAKARRVGELDEGIVDIKGRICAVGKSQVVYRDHFSQVKPHLRASGVHPRVQQLTT